MGEGAPGKWRGIFPGDRVLPRLDPPVVVTLSVIVFVTFGENMGDVVGTDHAVAVGFADLDAFVG